MSDLKKIGFVDA